MMPELSEETLDALIMGCDASDEYGPVVRTLVAAYRSAAAALRAERTRTETLRATVENLLGVLDDVIAPTGYTADLIQGDVLDAKRVLRDWAASVEETAHD